MIEVPEETSTIERITIMIDETMTKTSLSGKIDETTLTAEEIMIDGITPIAEEIMIDGITLIAERIMIEEIMIVGTMTERIMIEEITIAEIMIDGITMISGATAAPTTITKGEITMEETTFTTDHLAILPETMGPG